MLKRKSLIVFTTNIENVNSVILKEVWNATMKQEKKYQINKNLLGKQQRQSFTETKL